MDLRRLAFLASACAVIGFAAYMHDAQAFQTEHSIGHPPRLIDFFPLGTVIDLKRSNGGNSVKILDDDDVKRWQTQATDIIKSYETINAGPSDSENGRAEAESSLYALNSPWEVIELGENYIRLKPILKLPLHSNTPWIILPESSISIITPN